MVVTWKLWDTEIVAAQFNVVHEIEESQRFALLICMRAFHFLASTIFLSMGTKAGGMMYDVRLVVCLF
jgi:hypothetical protein